MSVIHVLKMVQVSKRDPEGETVPSRSAQLPRRPVFNGAPIREAGQSIGKGQLFQQNILAFDLALQIDDSEAHFDASYKFSVVKWFCKVVVGPCRQSFHHTLLFRPSSQQDDVRVGLMWSGPNLPAHFDASAIRHHPINNNNVGMMLGEEQECLLSAFRKDQGIPFVRQCEFNELSGDSRIVGYQDLRLLSDNSHMVVTKR